MYTIAPEPRKRRTVPVTEQNHLNQTDTVNLGSFYTPPWVVGLVHALIQKNVPNSGAYCLLDTSCGYGGFLRGARAIGADIDAKAIEIARKNMANHTYFVQNSLLGISRCRYNLSKEAKIIIVGNPPYNDTTSIIKNSIKKVTFQRDSEVLSRDLGISFLLSYNKLRADYVCVLHPLSYLIKKTNFEALGQFKNNYKLLDSIVISSGVFAATSKTTAFPIIVAFYRRDPAGMDYAYIKRYQFRTREGKSFSIGQYDTIGKYVSKYPNQKTVRENETVAWFYTMRDINALKRAATFLDRETANAVRITQSKLPYYCYADVFKEYISHIPYYFGNSDIMIDNSAFTEMKSLFEQKSVEKHPQLACRIKINKINNANSEIEKYFRHLLGEHYVD
jgi:tRNA G10  N-methylase Trm11